MNSLSTPILLFLSVRFILAAGSDSTSAGVSAAYNWMYRCPTSASQFASPTYPTTLSESECALACLTIGNCSLFSTQSGLSNCAMSSLGQVMSQWSPTSADSSCRSRFRAELYGSEIAGFWDFRYGSSLLLCMLPAQYTGTFAPIGATILGNSTDGAVMAGGSSDYAYLSNITGTPFEMWQNFSSTSSSLFMRVRRYGNGGPTGFFSLHSCANRLQSAVSVFETLENRLIVKVSSSSGTNALGRWVDSSPAISNEVEFVTLGFVYSASTGSLSLWRYGERSSEYAVFPLQPVEVPSPPLCVSLGNAYGTFSLQGGIRCMLIAHRALDIRVVDAAFIGC